MTAQTLRKIAILGPESSGKTTLCQALAQHLQCPYAQKYARFYRPANPSVYTESDLLAILHGQQRWTQQAIDSAKHQGSSWVIVDTEATVLAVWAHMSLGYVPELIEQACVTQTCTDYLLLAPDLPWEPDPLRSAPALEQRQAIFDQQAMQLSKHHHAYRIIDGNLQERMRNALSALGIDFSD